MLLITILKRDHFYEVTMSSIYDEVLTEMKKIAKKELPRLNARCMKLISEDISKMENIDMVKKFSKKLFGIYK